MIDELVAGIKNAMERGYSIEQAAQSFVNAGYNPAEVREAINILTSGATAILESNKPQVQQREVPIPNISEQMAQELIQQSLQQNQLVTGKTPSRKRKIIISLIILLILLIGGLILLIIFKNSILSLLSGNA